MQSPVAPIDPPARRTIRPSAVHNDNTRESDERLHQHIRHGVAEGRATPLLIATYFAAMVFFICLVLYGLNHQGNETAQEPPAAGAPATNSPAASGPAPVPETQQTQNAAPQPSQQQPNAPQGAQPNPPANAEPQGQGQQQNQQGSQSPAQQDPAPNGQQNAPAAKP
jgi:hypothetical protein